MTRNELKGKQTPGVAELSDNSVGKTSMSVGGRKACIATPWDNISPNEAEANAALYAEAHNVANSTGMWPKDLEQRVKELEEALLELVTNQPHRAQDNYEPRIKAAERARAILNKKP